MNNFKLLNTFIGMIGTLITLIGVIAVFSPQLMAVKLPQGTLDYFILYDWLSISILLIGLLLLLYPIAAAIAKILGLTGDSAFDIAPPDFANMVKSHEPTLNNIPWSPVKKGGSAIKTTSLSLPSPDKLVFSISKRLILLLVVVALIGIGLILLSLVQLSDAHRQASYAPLFIGITFIWISGFAALAFARPMVFDKSLQRFYKNFIPSSKGSNSQPLKRIYALQIVVEECSTTNDRYDSFELNLVLTDGSRINVMDHANESEIYQDARALAKFLALDIWQNPANAYRLSDG